MITTALGAGGPKRHQRIRAHGAKRAGGRGGHLLTRALSSPNNTGLPTLLHSRRPCPERSHRMPTTPQLASEEADQTLDAVGHSYRLQGDREPELPALKDHQEPRPPPTDDVVVKLLWPAIRDIGDKRACARTKRRAYPSTSPLPCRGPFAGIDGREPGK
jgi:hypothetical protein